MGDRRRRAASRRRRRRRRARPGTPPGTLIVDPEAPRPVITMLSYGEAGVQEARIAKPAEIVPRLAAPGVHWINVDGLGDAATLAEIGEIFGLHRLALEDVLNTSQRAKVEQYSDHLYLVAHEIHAEDGLATEQISMFVGANYVLTFQEQAGDQFDPVRARIREGRGRLRSGGPVYLAYALLDAIVDYYFPVLERLGERLERLEDEVLQRPRRRSVERIYALKRELLVMRRSMWPMRDALHGLLRAETPLIQTEDRYYLQDVYDHAMRVLEMIESFRETSASLLEVYLSSQGNRMNEIMKVLTMFASIFIPLSFIAGLYGMNFDTSSPWNMPELAWRYGYLFALGLMAAVAIALLVYFARKGWIGPGDRDDDAGDEGPGPPAAPGPPGAPPALMLLLIACAGCAPAPRADAAPDFGAHWQDGRAELDGYRLRISRYGEERDGEAVMVFVTEPFDPAQRVKADDPARAPGGTVEVLKLNLVRDFQTGIYDYNTMVSVFARSDDFEPLKVSMSSAEWCGHVYTELIPHARTVDERVMSYFQGESGTRTLERPPRGVFEDNLYIMLRGLRGAYLPPGGRAEVLLLEGPLAQRLTHRSSGWLPATIERRASPERVTVPAGTFDVAVYTVRTAAREGRFDIEQAYPHRIVRWSWTSRHGGRAPGERPGGDERAELAGSIRLPYWRLQREGDERYRSDLGLPPRGARE